ncbi:MAG: hypothetical protein ACJA09_003419 [Alcanivorax sp.]|jgi:hypothetical protein
MISQNPISRFDYHWLACQIFDFTLKKITPLHKSNPYDLGLSESSFKDLFLQRGDSYTAMDRGGYHPGTKVNVNSDFKKRLPIKSNVEGSFCRCFSWPTLCEPKTILNKLIRILTPGGLVVSQVPMPYWIHDAPYAFFRFIPPFLRRLLSKAAFVDLDIEPL